jgi:hypothetical protein
MVRYTDFLLCAPPIKTKHHWTLTIAEMLTGLSRLFQRRRRIALSKVEQSLTMETKTWCNYLSRRLAFPVSRNIHTLFCPDGMVETVSEPRENTKSLAALHRIDDNFRGSLRSSIRSEGLLSNVDRMQYEDDYGESNRQMSEHLEGHCDDEAAYYDDKKDGGSTTLGDNDDDIEVISRAFSVGSIDSLVMQDHEDMLSPNLLDDSEYLEDHGPFLRTHNSNQDEHVYDDEAQTDHVPQDVLGDSEYLEDHEPFPRTHYSNQDEHVYDHKAPADHVPQAYRDDQDSLPSQYDDGISAPECFHVGDVYIDEDDSKTDTYGDEATTEYDESAPLVKHDGASITSFF